MFTREAMSDKKTSGDVVKEDQSPAAPTAAAGQTGGGDHGNKKRTTSEPPTLDNTTTTEQQDHAKKQRKEEDEPAAAAAAAAAAATSEEASFSVPATAAAAAAAAATTEDISEEEDDDAPPVVWDLESALLQVTNADNKAPIEYLDDSEKAWVTFRLGHAGDASTLAALYRTSKAKFAALAAVMAAKVAAGNDDGKPAGETATTVTDRPPSPGEAAATKNLEAWLADGLGDDNKNPPAVFALVAEMECTPDAEAASAVKPVLKEEGDDDNDGKEKASAGGAAPTPRRLVAISILTIAPGTAFHNLTGKTTSTEQDTKEVQQAASDNKAEEKLQRAVQEGKRHMRVEWLYTVSDGDNVKDLNPEQLKLHKLRISMSEKRHLLRLAALAVMTKSQLILVDHDGNTTVIGGANRGSNNK